MNWLGSSTASHSTPWMPETPATSTRVRSWCSPWPNSWKSVMTSSCVNVAGSSAGGRREVAREVRHRMLDMRAGAAAVDRVVLPGPALLARTRVVVEIELADQRARARRRRRRSARPGATSRASLAADRDAVERLRHAEQSRQHFLFRKIAAHLLLGERESLRLQLLRRVRAVPRREIGDAELGGRECLELGVVALGKGLGAAREIAQERRARRRRSSPSWARARARRNSDSREAARPRGAAARRRRMTGAVVPRVRWRPDPKRASRRPDASSRGARDCRRELITGR